MAVVLKQIMIGSLNASGNISSTAPVTGKVQMIKNIRLVNKHASVAATINVVAGPSAGTLRLVSPQNMSLGPGQMYQDDGEFILNGATTDILNIAIGSTGGPVEYLVSGIERDQS